MASNQNKSKRQPADQDGNLGPVAKKPKGTKVDSRPGHDEPKGKAKRRRNKKALKAKKGTKGVTKLPDVKGGEMSTNWKNLMAEIAPPKPKKSGTHGGKFNKWTKKSESGAPKTNEEVPPAPDIWFDDVDEMLLDPKDREALRKKGSGGGGGGGGAGQSKESSGDGLVKDRAFKGVTKVLAIDCEMVGVGFGGTESILARVSIVNHFGHCIYDKFVQPSEKVTDYRTKVSGIRPKDIEGGQPFKEVQKEVSDLLGGRVLVGHALKHDLKVLFLDHPRRMVRDTAQYKPFRDAFGGRTPSLKNLTARMLGVSVQEGEHSSVQDAQAAMRLYTMFRKDWEKSLEERRKKKTPAPSGEKTKSSTAGKPQVTQSLARTQDGGKRAVYHDSDDND